MERASYIYAKASLLLGILAIVSIFFGGLAPFVFGGLAAILASLSRGSRRNYSSLALGGFMTGISAIAIYVFIIIISIILYSFVPEVREMVNSSISQIIGVELSDDFNIYSDFNSLDLGNVVKTLY